MIIEHPPYNSTSPFLKDYFNLTINAAIEYLRSVTNTSALVLDFGCGEGELKKRLPDYNIIGYDSSPELTEIDNFQELKPKIIFSHHVLEHLKQSELEDVIEAFWSMKPEYLIIAQPTENIISKIGRSLFKMGTHKEIGHKISINVVYACVKEYFELVEEQNIYTLTKVSKWKLKV